jgi:hypothetical protein
VTAPAEAAGDGALLAAVLHALETRARALRQAEPRLAAFAEWIGALGDQESGPLGELGLVAAERGGAARHYEDVAVMGFACARRAWSSSAIGDHIAGRFQEGVAWMRGRKFFGAGQTLGFEADGIALIGTAAGIRALADAPAYDTNRQWLVPVIAQSLQRLSSDTWDHALVRAAALLLDHGEAEIGAPAPSPNDLAPDMGAALASIGLVSLSLENERAARIAIVTPSYREVFGERAAAQAAGLRWLLRRAATALPSRATVRDVIQLLEGLPHALKRWPWEKKPRTGRVNATPQRWDVQNEYHVQSILWALLAPIFPDLEDEENLQSIGQAHPRADLAIPSLRLIIEAKFMRGGTQSDLTGIIGEISADTGLYLSGGSPFSQIIAVVWDDSRSNDHHAELRTGLLKLPGVRGAIVVSRPGRWDSPAMR